MADIGTVKTLEAVKRDMRSGASLIISALSVLSTVDDALEDLHLEGIRTIGSMRNRTEHRVNGLIEEVLRASKDS